MIFPIFRLPFLRQTNHKELAHPIHHNANTQSPTFALGYALFPQTN